jgi:hypothetical protein
MAVKYTKRLLDALNGHKTSQHLPLQDSPKLAKIWIFGLKIYHLATLRSRRRKMPPGKKIHFG